MSGNDWSFRVFTCDICGDKGNGFCLKAECARLRALRQPIRIGDRFEDAEGRVWRVTATRPGGHVDLFHRESTRFLPTYVKAIRAGRYRRLPPETA